jgi:ABC-type lipoprotein release transport system permease subunit
VARLLKAEVGGRVVAMAQGAESGEVRSALLRVVGVVDTGLEELDEGLVLTPLATLRGLLELGGAGHQVALILGDQAQSARVAAAARAAFPGLDVLTWAEADPQLAAAIRIDDGGHYLFNGIFFVIIAFMVLNTLLMSVLERRREFALLGALGLSPGRRLAIVLVEALLVALMAVAAGLAIGLGIHTYFRIHGLPLAWLTRESLETGGIVLDPVLRSVLSRGRIVGSATVVLALALLLGLVAGRRAAGPVDANLLKSR